MIGRMMESLIGAVGLKEFVFGTSFLSVSFKDQDSLEDAPSFSLSFPCSFSLPSHSPFLGSSGVFFLCLGVLNHLPLPSLTAC